MLEGSVRNAGSRIRVTAQLITAADGSHLWSERYDREMADVFAIQDEISQAIARALQINCPRAWSRPGTPRSCLPTRRSSRGGITCQVRQESLREPTTASSRRLPWILATRSRTRTWVSAYFIVVDARPAVAEGYDAVGSC